MAACYGLCTLWHLLSTGALARHQLIHPPPVLPFGPTRFSFEWRTRLCLCPFSHQDLLPNDWPAVCHVVIVPHHQTRTKLYASMPKALHRAPRGTVAALIGHVEAQNTCILLHRIRGSSCKLIVHGFFFSRPPTQDRDTTVFALHHCEQLINNTGFSDVSGEEREGEGKMESVSVREIVLMSTTPSLKKVLSQHLLLSLICSSQESVWCDHLLDKFRQGH